MKRLFMWLALAGMIMTATAKRAASPNGKLTVVTKAGGLVVNYGKQPVLEIPVLGFEGLTTEVQPQGDCRLPDAGWQTAALPQ